MKNFNLSLIEKKEIAQDILSLRFTKPQDLQFDAGQFIQFLIPDKEKQHKRAYSIASAPKDDSLEFIVKLWPNGKASQLFQDLQPGETCDTRGPMGHFTDTTTSPLILVGTGTGLAPILGIIQNRLVHEQSTKPIYLLAGFRTEKDIFKEEYLKNIAKKYSNFIQKITLSQPKTHSDIYQKGRVTDHILNHISDDNRYMLCGNPAMVQEVRSILTKNNISSEHITFEMY
tara:strand:- start:100 stop:786 length:687 start_codon:yes stop_codon:yes gene_type:complete